MESEVDLAVSDPAELGALAEWLRATPGVRTERRSGVPGPGEQGALDYLTIIASSTVLAAAIQVLPAFLKARRPGLTVVTKVKGQDVTIRGDNADEVLPILERLLES